MTTTYQRLTAMGTETRRCGDDKSPRKRCERIQSLPAYRPWDDIGEDLPDFLADGCPVHVTKEELTQAKLEAELAGEQYQSEAPESEHAVEQHQSEAPGGKCWTGHCDGGDCCLYGGDLDTWNDYR